jgi:hypothetical protein
MPPDAADRSGWLTGRSVSQSKQQQNWSSFPEIPGRIWESLTLQSGRRRENEQPNSYNTWVKNAKRIPPNPSIQKLPAINRTQPVPTRPQLLANAMRYTSDPTCLHDLHASYSGFALNRKVTTSTQLPTANISQFGCRTKEGAMRITVFWNVTTHIWQTGVDVS